MAGAARAAASPTQHLLMCRKIEVRQKIWVKLSAPYNSSRKGLINDPEVADIARALISWAPERMVWGTNWPHPEHSDTKPNDFDLYQMFCDWIPERSRRKMILSENPATLYGLNV